MADKKVSQLDNAAALDGTEEIPGTQGGVTVAISVDQIEDQIEEGTSPHLEAYSRKSGTLTQSGGTLTIPLDGRSYQCTPSQAITTITTTSPGTGKIGEAEVFFVQGSTGYAVSVGAAWEWPARIAGAISATANARTRLTLSDTPMGTIMASTMVIGTAL